MFKIYDFDDMSCKLRGKRRVAVSYDRFICIYEHEHHDMFQIVWKMYS